MDAPMGVTFSEAAYLFTEVIIRPLNDIAKGLNPLSRFIPVTGMKVYL
jgi:hypothetical protein